MSQGSSTPLPSRVYNPSTMSTTVPSPTSSVINLNLNDGLIIHDAEADNQDVAEDEEQVGGIFTGSSEDSEQRKKILREQLRKTLSSKDLSTLNCRISPDSDPSQQSRTRIPEPSTVDEAIKILEQQFPQRQYFILTDAGKPVFVRSIATNTVSKLVLFVIIVSRPGNAVEDVVAITGITSALISVFADESLSANTPKQDRLRSIQSGSTRITFFLKSPLYYIVISKWGEPESVARLHLEFLHLQILRTESFLHAMISRLQSSIAFQITLSALSVVRMEPMFRSRIGDYLVPSKTGSLDILYILLISENNLITIVRPKRHSIHPSDLQILINAVHTSSVAANSASWLPICLPKFNPQGFVHAYVNFIESDSFSIDGSSIGNKGKQSSNPYNTNTATPTSETNSTSGTDTIAQENNMKTLDDIIDDTMPRKHSIFDPLLSNNKSGMVLLTVCGGGEFDVVRNWSEAVAKVTHSDVISDWKQTDWWRNYENLSIPGLRHFIYKSRVHVQITYPAWEDHYHIDTNRLITLYQKMHDTMHAKSGQKDLSNYSIFELIRKRSLVTQPFELYVALSPMIPKKAAISAANAVARWE
ncbi:hypothetical protein Clacol_007536 [Clathrus columnatus]|uniref:Vacuolar fusion protein MON1 n=1 Tax=Clathrus columnatus TaxID=1419009 RepID=A0AAV5AMY7_9AGAM|nr:hypothetical protein Clacol_007536 [Clathrus columnatus]